MPEPGLSVVVTTCLRPEALTRCLASVASVADELVVVDVGDDPATALIAESASARLLRSPNHLMLNRTKAKGLDAATRTWTLLLDDDESLTPALAEEIRRFVAADPPEPVALRLTRRTWELGREMRRRDRPIRLVRTGRARFALRDVHEQLDVDGTCGQLHELLDHHPDQRVSSRVHTQNLYSEWWAIRAHADGRPFRPLRLAVRPLITLAGQLTRRRRLRDGLPGFAFAVHAAYSVFLQELKLWERHREGEAVPPDVLVGERLPPVVTPSGPGIARPSPPAPPP